MKTKLEIVDVGCDTTGSQWELFVGGKFSKRLSSKEVELLLEKYRGREDVEVVILERE
jgi:hypothetical protein